jgi:hypothetical protein
MGGRTPLLPPALADPCSGGLRRCPRVANRRFAARRALRTRVLLSPAIAGDGAGEVKGRANPPHRPLGPEDSNGPSVEGGRAPRLHETLDHPILG